MKLFRTFALTLAVGAALVSPMGHTQVAKAKAAVTSASTSTVDINTASADQLKAIPGIGDVYAQKIIAGRPYANKTQLVSKKVLPQTVYNKVKDKITAKQ